MVDCVLKVFLAHEGVVKAEIRNWFLDLKNVVVTVMNKACDYCKAFVPQDVGVDEEQPQGSIR